MDTKTVQCRKCKYYYITWDTQFPYGCKLFGVKSKQLPSIVVYKSTGKFCDNFTTKNNVHAGEKNS